jgi:hypothetical protein
MFHHEPSSIPEAPRHPHQETVDLLATAFLRLRQHATSAANGDGHASWVGRGLGEAHGGSNEPALRDAASRTEPTFCAVPETHPLPPRIA